MFLLIIQLKNAMIEISREADHDAIIAKLKDAFDNKHRS